MSDEIIFEGWKQVADAIRYSERQTYRHYEQVKDRLTLRHYLGPGHRMKMSREEIEAFKNLILQDAVRYRQRSPLSRIMAEDVRICQAKLFD